MRKLTKRIGMDKWHESLGTSTVVIVIKFRAISLCLHGPALTNTQFASGIMLI